MDGAPVKLQMERSFETSIDAGFPQRSVTGKLAPVLLTLPRGCARAMSGQPKLWNNRPCILFTPHSQKGKQYAAQHVAP